MPTTKTSPLRERLLNSGQGWFPAVFPGTCEGCGKRFKPGTAIRMRVPMGWRAECCAEAPNRTTEK